LWRVLTDTLRVRMTKALKQRLAREARRAQIKPGTYARRVLEQHVAAIAKDNDASEDDE
jgi:predicted HicB family RNase H-like nuclease